MNWFDSDSERETERQLSDKQQALANKLGLDPHSLQTWSYTAVVAYLDERKPQYAVFEEQHGMPWASGKQRHKISRNLAGGIGADLVDKNPDFDKVSAQETARS
jgi:hypothetical protein